jgi:peptidoglycan/LPS O-acetylase OafA/YrhL
MHNKVAAAEGIRGIACFMVVLSHLSLSFFPYLHGFGASRLTPYAFEYAIHHSPFAFFFSGTAAVYIFFVLSGYVLTYAISKGQQQDQKIKVMLIKRYPRLMLPALGSCLLLWLAFGYVQPNGIYLAEWIDIFGSEYYGSLADTVYDGMIRTFWNGYSAYNWVLWTMKIELIGSLLVFGLLYARLKNFSFYWTAPIGLLLSYIAIRMLPFTGIDHFAHLSVMDVMEKNLEMLCFLFGMLIFFKFRLLGNAVSVVLLLIGLYCAGVHNNSWSYQWIYQWLGDRSYNILNFLSGIFIVSAILMNQSLSKVFSTKIPVYLGKISFAAYLNHLLIIYVIGIPVFNYLYRLKLDYLVAVSISLSIIVLCTVLFSELYYRLVDKKSMQFSNTLASLLIKTQKKRATE